VIVTPLPNDVGVTVPEMFQSAGAIARTKVLLTPPAVAVNVPVWEVATAVTVAVNPAVVVAAATFTLAGTFTFVLLLDSVTVTPADGAAPLNVTVQADVPAPVTLAGEHVRLVSEALVPRLTAVLTLLPLNVAVTAAVWLVVMVPAFAVKAPVLAPVAMVTLAGTASRVVLLESVTVEELTAALFKVTVQVADCAEASAFGVQPTDESCRADTKLSEAVFEIPPAAAVSVAVWLPVMDATVAVKPTLVAAAGTVTLAGTVTEVLLLARVTPKPPAGAAPLKATVQAEVPGAVTLDGLQERPVRVVVTACVTVIVPPVPVDEIVWPVAVEATTLVI
jgi:hypothetical protein